MEDVLATLNSRELEKRTEGTKEVTSDELYVKGRSYYSGKVHSGESSRFKSRGRNGKLKSFLGHSKGHLKRVFLMKKSSGFVKKGKHDLDFDSSDDEGGSYHMTHKRDFLYDFKVIDDGSVQLEDVKYVPRLRRSLISLGTLEKEGYTVKMQMGRIKKKHGDSNQVGFKQLFSKQVGFKQLGPGVKTVVHGVQVDKRVLFEVEVHGAQGNRETEVFQVGARIMVTGVSGKEDAEGNVAKKKEVKEYMEANLGKLLKYNA
nr:hypothetical protein [Tanacetum cinerariifolium]